MKPGKYSLKHERFGEALVEVLRADDTWVDCRILSGVLRGKNDAWGPGQVKTLRISHGTWAPLKEAL